MLETLGLMNNTVSNPDQAKISFRRNENEEVDLIRAWKENDTHLARLRSESFSFIFQETNLMPGLTAGENLCMKLLIQGSSAQKAREYAFPFMQAIGLDNSLFDRSIYQLSGGQRQRLAFLRAFLGSSEVLFCDEPTGNLDAATAHSLMQILKESISTGKRKLAIIVSHDLGLAESYGDMVIPVTGIRDPEYPDRITGQIWENDILTKKDQVWADLQGGTFSRLTEALSKKNNNAESIQRISRQ